MFNIYGLDMVKRYEGHQIGDLPPHLFAIGSASYSKMVKEKENQVLVISGESGAGKTESTKLVMQYLAAVNKSGNNLITEQILEANPLLESFGNAKTIRNDNSSRFGKYIEVFFKDGAIVGARTLEYLLEKSRIVTQGGSAVIPGRDDAENYRKLVAAMDILDFTRDEQDTIQKILASVLHVGNVYFKSLHVDNHDTVELGSDAEIRWVSHLLQLSEDWLKQALISKVTEARGDRVVSPYNLDQALDARDAIAKALYSRLFTWLVERVNLIICRAEREKTTSLAVLDIFGFEDFHHNSFEQLCINYANETLQYFFNQHIFQLEQKEYTKEKIRWQHIEFKDNQPVIDLIATKPTGILHILDDECNFPQSRDHSFLEKCHFHHSGNPLYDKPRMSDPEFYIVHYAGRIKYNVLHFIEKNKDTLRSDVVELMCESKNKIIAQMFGDLRDRQITKTLSKTTGRYVTLKPRTPTVAASFNESLLSLIDTMSRCHPFFVRCVKNTTKSAMLFEDQVVSDQLRYTGMLETIRIRKMGYPIRSNSPSSFREVCAMILATLGPSYKDQYQIGATKVFMKETFEIHIDEEAATIQRDAAIRIQTRTRAFLARNKFLKARAASRKIQRTLRMWKSRREFLATRNGIVRAQAQFRMFIQRRRYIHTREEIRRKLEEEKLARRRQEAQEKLEREQRERAARAMASINNLEVPGELAFVYSKLDDWRPVHDGGNIMAAVGDVQPMDMGYRLPVDINSHPFSKYTSVYFKDPKWGVRMEPLRGPLTSVQSDEIAHRAVSLFKLILRCMCEQNISEKREKILSDYIVQMGLQHEGLRDELLCQLANQTWQNQNPDQMERAWRLITNALCCFMPSPTLFKYYLKYVSDVGVNGYKWMCQHKVLQSANMEPQLSRIYPPTFLEWRAIQRKANMALEVKFPDDVNIIGHVESWTSGELFASHLLKQRGVKENTQGWTLMLAEDIERYELMGYDYALDLISEMEVAPGFPTCKAYFLASTDRTQERLHHKRHHEGPHNAEQERILVLTHPLPEMLKRSTPVVSPGHPSAGGSRGVSPRSTSVSPADELGFSTTSVLNQRPTEIFSSELSESRMNVRYTKRRAPAPPPNGHIPNGHINGVMNGGVVNGDMSIITEDEDDLDLSQTRINTRYFPEGVPNGNGGDLSNSRLNTRYTKKVAPGPSRKSAVQDQIRKKQGGGVTAADVHSVTSEHSDWSHWVEDVFSSALDEHDDGVSEGKSLHTRIKGGGKGVPGIQTQQTNLPPNLNLGVGLTTPTSVVAPPMVSPAFAFNAQLTPGLQTSPEALQQLVNQQAMQQQAAQQAAIQALLLQDQQRQQAQQAALLQAYQQQQQQQAQQQNLVAQAAAQQQVVSLQAALQQTELENRLLKQSIERENLRKQLQQAQSHTISPPGSAGFAATSFSAQQASGISPDSSFNAGLALPPGVLQSPRESQQFAHSSSESMVAGGAGKVGPAVAPKRVQFIKSNFESRPGTSYSSEQAEEVHKQEVQVGKLEIDEKVAQGIENRIIGKKKWQKPAAPADDERPKSILKKGSEEGLRMRRAKSLVETSSHIQTMKLLESKLGGKSTESTATEAKPAAPKAKPAAASVALQTTDTLKRASHATATEDESIYAQTIVQDEPPPLPSRPPPQLKMLRKETVEVEEKFETVIRPDKAPSPETFEKRIETDVPQKAQIDYAAFERVITELFPQNKRFFLMYNKVPWTLFIRKEVFWPSERLENSTVLHLIYCQVVQDVYSNACVRISKDQRVKMRSMLEGYGVNKNNFLTKELNLQVKKVIVDTAKEWPTYFCRLFPVALDTWTVTASVMLRTEPTELYSVTL
nr:hypothetical protein BaRGS_000177 [Batillaria attramentaria]